ncbi:MAG TPA: SURF1 family protein [Rhodanobacteraceae bacterium]
MSTPEKTVAAPSGRGMFVVWMVLAALFFVIFTGLGTWQVRRLGWKLKLIHDVNTRVHAAVVETPGRAKWDAIKAGHLQFLHVQLAGHFVPGKQTLVHGSSDLGYGFWVMAPLLTQRGFTVMVNRGWVPANTEIKPGAEAKIAPPTGQVSLTGLLRFSMPGGSFLRSNKPAKNLWYSRDVMGIAKARGLNPADVAPYFVDEAAVAGQKFPAGGLTRIHFRNEHLSYAITWYLLALGTLLGAWIVIKHRKRDLASRVRPVA